MKKEELAKYLNEIETMDLVDALYDGEIHIEDQIECKMDDDYLDTRVKVEAALLNVYSASETLEILDELEEIEIKRLDQQNRFCFKQGIKIGLMISDLLKKIQCE